MAKIKKALITGSSGLVGAECVKLLCQKDFEVYGVDNDLRAYFFGPESSTAGENVSLERQFPNFHHVQQDIRNAVEMEKLFRDLAPFDLIIHAAAQPAHDWSMEHPFEDQQVNAWGTLVMLENYRKFSADAVFIQVSTSKVYGDHVNRLPLKEYRTRYDLPEKHPWFKGIDETMSIENAIHSLFGVSKTAGDLTAQEYGRYYHLKTAIFRPVCITGPTHKGARLHGYLSYLVKCIASGTAYTINGYKGKQVRDNIHSADLVRAFWEVYKNPKFTYGEVYNIGAGRKSNNSILEAIKFSEEILHKKAVIKYSPKNRVGDHMWCIFNPRKFENNYPGWVVTYDNDKLMRELCLHWEDVVKTDARHSVEFSTGLFNYSVSDKDGAFSDSILEKQIKLYPQIAPILSTNDLTEKKRGMFRLVAPGTEAQKFSPGQPVIDRSRIVRHSLTVGVVMNLLLKALKEKGLAEIDDRTVEAATKAMLVHGIKKIEEIELRKKTKSNDEAYDRASLNLVNMLQEKLVPGAFAQLGISFGHLGASDYLLWPSLWSIVRQCAFLADELVLESTIQTDIFAKNKHLKLDPVYWEINKAGFPAMKSHAAFMNRQGKIRPKYDVQEEAAKKIASKVAAILHVDSRDMGRFLVLRAKKEGLH